MIESRGKPGEIVICDATLDDLDAMHAIEVRAFAHPWSCRLLAKEFEHDFSRQRLARDSEGRTIGFLICWMIVDEVHVLDVAVDPGSRRKGFGRALLEDCARLARERPARSISLEVRSSNEGARRLYRELGFRVIGERPRYYAADGEDAVVLEWLL